MNVTNIIIVLAHSLCSFFFTLQSYHERTILCEAVPLKSLQQETLQHVQNMDLNKLQ